MTPPGADPIDLIRRGHELFSRGDLADLREIATPDVEWGTVGTFPGIDPVYRGLEGMAKWAADLHEPMQSFEVTMGEILVERPDRILIEERIRARGSESGIQAEMLIFSAYLAREGKIAKRVCFTDRDEALGAVDAL